jgi:protein O-mannosyl-transferase
MNRAMDPGDGGQPAAEQRSGRWRFGLDGALLFLLAFVVYWPALRGQFVWDDVMLVHQNPLVTGKLGLGTIWFRTDFPLANIAFWAQWRLWGDHPAGYHAVNVLLHATSALLLWRVLWRLRIPGGWLAAVIFTVHPVCVASVAWVSELKNTLSLPFYLLSMLWFLRSDAWQDQSRRTRAVGWYLLSLAAFLVALSSKTSTVMLPAILLGCALWQHGRITLRDLAPTGPFFALALAFGLMSVWFQVHGAMAGATVQAENFWGRLAGAGMALWFYLWKALLPLHLSMIYPRWTVNAAAPVSYLPLLLWCGLFTLCWWFRRAWGRHALFGLGCFTVTLFPVLGFLDMYFLALSRVSDHFEYLPLTAIVAMGAAGLSVLLKTNVLRFIGGALVLGLGVLTVNRAQVFATEELLWRNTLAENPAAWCAHANLGWILAGQRKYDEAITHLAASLQFHPNNAQAHSNLGRVLSLQGKFGEAEGHFLTALKLKPNDANIRRSHASALAEGGKKEAAAKELLEVLRLQPDVEVHLQLATLLYETGQFREALAEYRQVLGMQPDSQEGLSNQAWLLAACSDPTVRDGREAVRLAGRACRLTDFKQAQMVGVLAAAYAEAGRFTDAVATAQQAIEVATAAGDTNFVATIRRLLALYRTGRPYHEAPSSSARSRVE